MEVGEEALLVSRLSEEAVMAAAVAAAASLLEPDAPDTVMEEF